jgi:hypothetical protein
MTDPAVPRTAQARIVATDPDGPEGPQTPYVEIEGQRWPIPAAGSPYELVAQLFAITGRWHIVPAPKVVRGPRPPARGAHSPEPGVLLVDVEEVLPPEA